MDWLKNLSWKEMLGIVLTVVWAILMTVAAEELSVAVEEWPGFQLQVFAVLWGNPVVIGWGIYWVRRSPTGEGSPASALPQRDMAEAVSALSLATKVDRRVDAPSH